MKKLVPSEGRHSSERTKSVPERRFVQVSRSRMVQMRILMPG